MTDTAMTTSAKTDLRTAISKMEGQFKLALPKHISSDRFMRIIFTAVQRNPVLLQCTRESVLASVMRAAEQGLIPDGRQGALVPYRNKGVMEAQFIPMWQGLLDLARQSSAILDAFPASVRERDEFSYQLGLHRDLVHKPAIGDRGEIKLVYAVVILKDGMATFGPGPMTVAEVDAIRGRSKAAQSGPWVTDWEPMAWKTVLKRVLKYVPQSPELQAALEQDNEAEFGDWHQMPAEQTGDFRAAIQAAVERERTPVQKVGQWPKREVDELGNISWIDSSGEEFSLELHGWNAKTNAPSINADGTFRAKRGSGDQKQAVEKSSPAGAEVVVPATAVPAVNAKAVLHAIKTSQNRDELDEAMSVASDSLTGGDLETAQEMYRVRLSEIAN